MLKLVPFNAMWIQHDKIDVHAIYRRPRYREDEYGEKYPVPWEWDLTGPLPVKMHNKWSAKGFEYITLANRDSLITAGRLGTIAGDWRTYDQHQYGGPWNYKKYAEGMMVTDAARADVAAKAEAILADQVKTYGWETVEAIRKQTDPTFSVPEHMKKQKAKVA